MSGQEITSILFTAVVGFIFGVYLFFSGFLPVLVTNDVQTQEKVNSFSIVSEVYGGCRSECPSFQSASDGSYRYQYTPAIDEDQVIRDGSIPRSLKRELSGAVSVAVLEAQSQEIQPSICSSYTDGIDVVYRITYDGTEYEIDTCGTAIDTSSRLWNALVKTWNYFETGKS